MSRVKTQKKTATGAKSAKRKAGAAAARPLACIVLAAGQGTRMRSAAAKVLHVVAGRPLISHVLTAVEGARPQRIVVVVGHQAEAVRETVGGRAECVLQAEQRGTGHAVGIGMKRLRGFAGDVLVVCGDVPLMTTATLKGLLREHRKRGATATVLGMHVDDPSDYGRIVGAGDGDVRIVEYRDASPAERRITEVNSGTYCFDAEFLRKRVGGLASNNAQGEFYLTDLLEVASCDRRAALIVAEDDSETLGVNTRFDLARAEALMQERILIDLMDKGVGFLDPSSVYVSADAKIARDVIIGPSVRIDGATRIGEGTQIDGCCHLADTVIGRDCHIKWGTVTREASMRDGCILGPYAHLRPQAELAEGVHIGNFVEVKKSKIGRGSKANHLTYIGDTTIGRATNIGAGTITCNYDGFAKHSSVIGDRVQIGSDTQLVAPVRLGNDVFVAAGTTVTKDVPAGSLAMNEKRQLNRKGWVAQFRKRAAATKKVK